MSERFEVEDLVHRVNNLLGTIEIQVEVARTIGTVEAHADALRLILESARRTRVDLQRSMGHDGSAEAES